MIGTPRLVGLYVQPDREGLDVEGRRSPRLANPTV
jgi:hypothetical protein